MPAQPLRQNEVTERVTKPSLAPAVKPSSMGKRIWNEVYLRLFVAFKEKVLMRGPMRNFYMTFGGHAFFQGLYTAVELDLFTILAERGAMSVDEIRRALGLAEQPCRILLLNLVCSRMLRKKGDRYQNTFSGNVLFNRHSPRNVNAYVRLQHHVYYRTLFHFHESVRANANLGVKVLQGTGATLYERLEHNPEIRQIFQSAMSELSNQTNRTLATYLDLSKSRFLVDIGGGDASNIIALAEANPHLKAAIFDFPGVTKIALEKIREHGLEHRLSAVEGDIFRDSHLPAADTFLFCHFFTMWSKDEDLRLLRVAYQALPPGGRTIIYNMMQRNDGRGPLSAGLGSPYFLACATGRGMLYTWNEYIELFREAGYRKVITKRFPMDHGVIIGVKA